MSFASMGNRRGDPSASCEIKLMEKHETLRNLLLSAAVFVLVLWGSSKLMPPPRTPTAPPPAASQGPPAVTEASGLPTPPPPGDAVDPAAPPADRFNGFTIEEAPDARILIMGFDPPTPPSSRKDYDAAPYRMRLLLSNVGASIETAAMTDHAATLGSDERYTLLSPVDDRYRSLAVEQINIEGTVLPLADKRWHVDELEPYETEGEKGQQATFRLDIEKNGVPALRLIRTYRLPVQPVSTRRHDLFTQLRVENLADQPLRVVLTTRGGVGVPLAGTRGDDRYVDWGVFDGERVNGMRKLKTEASRDPTRPIKLFSPSDRETQRLSWAATANTYFTCTIAPLAREAGGPAPYLADVSAIDLDGDAFTTSDVTVRFVSRPETIASRSALSYPTEVYLGEKDGISFHQVAAYQERNYYFQIAQGFGWCTFTWLVELMVWLLNHLYVVTRDFGFAIIILVLIVRVLLHPITKKGQVNMVRMQHSMGQLAPKLEEIRKKHANDKAKLQQETMQVYREQGINPASQMLTCLPMFIQMPIWVALFLSLSNNIHMRHEPAFWGLTWIQDLTAPDALIPFSAPFTIPLVGWQVAAFNLLPILVALFMYTQQKLQPKPAPNPNMSDQQRQQQEMMQKMMPMMSIMMLILFYNGPSGLNLYIMFSSLFGTIEQHRIRKHIKDREAAGTLHKTPAESGGPRRMADRWEEPKPKGRIQAWFAQLQKMAENAQKAQPKRPAKGKARR